VPEAESVALDVKVAVTDRVPRAPVGDAIEGVGVGVAAKESVVVEEGDSVLAALGVQEGENVARLERVLLALGVNDTEYVEKTLRDSVTLRVGITGVRVGGKGVNEAEVESEK